MVTSPLTVTVTVSYILPYPDTGDTGETTMSTDRETREIELATRVAELRAQAATKQAESDRLSGTVNRDGAFWTQPAYGNAAGRNLASQRDRARTKIIKAGEIAAEASALRDKANSIERRGVVMAGDADAARALKIARTDVSVGQMVDTTHYGIRKVVKVNAKTVCVEGSFGPLKISKEFVRVAA